ncbi:NACHT domain-containing protein [Streptacidiphilus sp. PAMC 29251]
MFWNNIQDTLLTRARLGQGTAVKRGMVEIIVDAKHIPVAHDGLDFWDGASGSAVWCGGTLIGVLALNRGRERRDSAGAPWLAAARIDHLLTIRRFREALVAHGVAPVVHEITHPHAQPELVDDTLPALAPQVASDHAADPGWPSWLRPANVLLLFGALVLTAQLWTQTARSDGLTAMGALAMLGAGLRLLQRKPEEAGDKGRLVDLPQTGVEDALRTGFRIAVARRRRNLLPHGEHGRSSRPAIDVTFQLHPTARLQPLHASTHGSFATVAEYFLDLDPRRLVITGEAGSGKTLLALELANSLLQEDSGPLAYVISLADWNPDEAAFLDWAATATADALEGVDVLAVRELIRAGRLVPVLDGLDEMDPVASDDLRASRALEAMEEYSGAFVLTCRREAFARLETVSGEGFLPTSAVVLVDPVDSRAAQEYLRKRHVDASVLVGLETESDADLNSPWLLSLAGDILGGGHSESLQSPALGSGPFAGANTAQELRKRLISQLVPARVAQQRPGRGRHAYSEEAALYWLSVLARFMVTEGIPTFPGHPPSRQDIVPHRLWPITGPHAPRLAAALLTVLLWAPLLACLAIDCARRGMFPSPGILLLSLIALLPISSAWAVQRRWVQPRDINPARLRSRLGLSRIGLGGIVGGASGLVIARFTDPTFGLAFGGGFAFVFGLGFAVAVRKDVYTKVVAVVGVGTALVTGVLADRVLGRFGADGGIAAGWGAGALGLLLGIPRGIAFRQHRTGGMPDPEYDGVPTPSTAVHRDFLVGATERVKSNETFVRLCALLC